MGKLKDMTLKKAFYLIVSVTAVVVLCLSAVSVRICSRIHDRITLSHAFRMDAAVFDYEDGGYFAMEAETGGTEDGHMEFTDRELWICRITEILMVFLPVLFSALGIVCAGTCFYHVKLKEPLTALKQGISHIADNDLDFSIGYGKQDELGELCRAFETMRGKLVKNNRYMWGLVEERKKINASIAHDLRTPITVIKGYSEYLDRNAAHGKLQGISIRPQSGWRNMRIPCVRFRLWRICAWNTRKSCCVVFWKKCGRSFPSWPGRTGKKSVYGPGCRSRLWKCPLPQYSGLWKTS